MTPKEWISGILQNFYAVIEGVFAKTTSLPTKLSDLTDDVVSGNYLPIGSGLTIEHDGYTTSYGADASTIQGDSAALSVESPADDTGVQIDGTIPSISMNEGSGVLTFSLTKMYRDYGQAVQQVNVTWPTTSGQFALVSQIPTDISGLTTDSIVNMFLMETVYDLAIVSSGVWQTNTNNIAFFVPLDGFTQVEMITTTTHVICAFLTDNTYTSGSTASFATGYTERIVQEADTDVIYDIPSDAKYFYAVRHTSTTDWSDTYTIHLKGNGSLAELTTNKVTTLSSVNTDNEYPSAKCVYDMIGDIETLLAAL